MSRARVQIVTVSLDGQPFEIASLVTQAIVGFGSGDAGDEHDRAILKACESVPDDAVGWRGATPGVVWEPVRRAIAAKRALDEADAEVTPDDEVKQ